MPIRTTISNRRFYTEAVNGSDFSLNPSDTLDSLAANVGERVRYLFEVSLEWFANSDISTPWRIDVVAKTIELPAGSFFDEGIREGQRLEFLLDWSGARTQDFTFDVDSISSDGAVLTYSLVTGSESFGTSEQDNVAIRSLPGEAPNFLTSLFYTFGLPENSDGFSNLNRATGTGQAYSATGIGVFSGTRSTAFVDMSADGPVFDWVTGSARVRFVQDVGAAQQFEIEHTFRINPVYIEGQEADLQAGTPPLYFSGTQSLKYVFDADFRFGLTNPNDSISIRESDRTASVGWFGESFNGGASDYTVETVAFVDVASTDSVDGLQLNSRTRATMTVRKASGNYDASDKLGVLVSTLAKEEDYSGGLLTQDQNFGTDSLFATAGAGAVAGTGIVKSLTVTVASDLATVIAEIEYTATEAGRFISSDGYLLAVTAFDSTVSSQADGGRVTEIASVDEYADSLDVPGLIDFTKFDILFGSEEVGVDTGTTDFKGWPQDALSLDFEFDLDLSASKAAFLRTLEFALIAYNSATGESFRLDSYSISVGSVVSGGIQQIELDTSRVYPDNGREDYSEVSITTGAKVGDLQKYSGVFAQRVRWEDWLFNADADQVFFDASKPNNGLNFFSPDFSGLNGYTIHLAAFANLDGLDTNGILRNTDYRILSPSFDIYDWGTTSDWSITIETFRNATGSATNGTVLVGEDTLIRATFDNAAGDVTDLTDVEVWIRIQKADGSGQQVFEASNSAIGSDSLLKPKTGENFVSLNIVGGDVVAEILADGSKTQAGGYFISARIKAPEAEFVLFEDGDSVLFEDGTPAKFEDQ